MDAYDIQKEIFEAWQKLAKPGSATTLKKQWSEVPVYVDGKQVIDVTIEEGKIRLKT
jgi:hypothetical protein